MPSTCFMPIHFTPFCSNIPYQFTPIVNLRSIIFGLMPYLDVARRVWISQNRTNLGGCVFTAHCVSYSALAIWFMTMRFICFYLSIFSTYIQYNDTQSRNKKPGLAMNSCSSNLSGSNMCGLWVMRWLCSKACVSEFCYLGQNICDSNNRGKFTIHDKPS